MNTFKFQVEFLNSLDKQKPKTAVQERKKLVNPRLNSPQISNFLNDQFQIPQIGSRGGMIRRNHNIRELTAPLSKNSNLSPLSFTSPFPNTFKSNKKKGHTRNYTDSYNRKKLNLDAPINTNTSGIYRDKDYCLNPSSPSNTNALGFPQNHTNIAQWNEINSGMKPMFGQTGSFFSAFSPTHNTPKIPLKTLLNHSLPSTATPTSAQHNPNPHQLKTNADLNPEKNTNSLTQSTFQKEEDSNEKPNEKMLFSRFRLSFKPGTASPKHGDDLRWSGGYSRLATHSKGGRHTSVLPHTHTTDASGEGGRHSEEGRTRKQAPRKGLSTEPIIQNMPLSLFIHKHQRLLQRMKQIRTNNTDSPSLSQNTNLHLPIGSPAQTQKEGEQNSSLVTVGDAIQLINKMLREANSLKTQAACATKYSKCLLVKEKCGQWKQNVGDKYKHAVQYRLNNKTKSKQRNSPNRRKRFAGMNTNLNSQFDEYDIFEKVKKLDQFHHQFVESLSRKERDLNNNLTASQYRSVGFHSAQRKKVNRGGISLDLQSPNKGLFLFRVKMFYRTRYEVYTESLFKK